MEVSLETFEKGSKVSSRVLALYVSDRVAWDPELSQ